MTQWKRPLNRQPPVPADEIDVGHPTRVPARAHYIPLEQREATSLPRPVFVVDQRQRGGRNRTSVSPRAARRLSPAELQDKAPARSSASRMRQTQDDPQYDLQRRDSQPVRAAPAETWEQDERGPHPRRRMHWVFFIGVGMLGMLLLWYGGLALVSWWQVSQDDLHYGRPRTFQCDAVVGHHDSPAHPSHFIALNYHRQVEIIEFPRGDSSHARIYIGPPLIGPGEDLAVVTLSFRDVNGDGKPDMLVTVAGSQVIFINDQGQFRPLRNGEHVTL